MNEKKPLSRTVNFTRLAQLISVAAALVLVLYAQVLSAAQTGAASAEVSFAKDIQPIFNANCATCHNNTYQSGELSLETYDALMKGGAKGHEIVAGDSGKSRLALMVEGKVSPSMPPGGKLKAEEIKAIKAWIDAGARSPKEADTGATVNAATPAAKPLIPDIKPLAPVAAPVTSIVFRPDGKTIAATNYKEARIIAWGKPESAQSFSGMNSAVRSLAYSLDGKLLAAGGGLPAQFGEITIWDAETGKVLHNLKGHRDYIYSLSFSPDNKLLATASYDRLIKIWDVEKGVELKTLKDHIDAVYPVAFTPDGKQLASGSADRTVKFWDVESGRRLFTLSDSTDVVYTIAFHPSGKQLSAAGADRIIRTWDITESGGTLKNSSIAHEGEIVQIIYSPDGSMLASASADRTIKLWNAETGQLIKALEKQPDWAVSIAFSPDGLVLVAGSFDGSIKAYDIATGKLAQVSIRAATR